MVKSNHICYLINGCVKVKESFEKTRQFKNNDKFKKYILRGQKNTRYHEKYYQIKRNLIIYHNFVISISRRL